MTQKSRPQKLVFGERGSNKSQLLHQIAAFGENDSDERRFLQQIAVFGENGKAQTRVSRHIARPFSPNAAIRDAQTVKELVIFSKCGFFSQEIAGSTFVFSKCRNSLRRAAARWVFDCLEDAKSSPLDFSGDKMLRPLERQDALPTRKIKLFRCIFDSWGNKKKQASPFVCWGAKSVLYNFARNVIHERSWK